MIDNEVKDSPREDGSEDDDTEGYFLQTTSNSYDIKEKIREANNELYEVKYNNDEPRSQKVTFKEDLVDYEPDYSSDDGYVHSPDALTISDENNEELEKDRPYLPTVDPAALPIVLEELDLSDHEEQPEIVEEIEDEIIEIIHINDELDDDLPETDAEISSIKCDDISIDDNILDLNKCKKRKKSSKTETPIEINCRLHCLEEKNLDFIGSPIKIPRKMDKGPRLQLRPRKCCEHQNHRPKLPVYNGLISEYGLTETQLERRRKHKERKAKREMEKKVRLKEEKIQKDICNEEMFCTWLKSVADRRKHYEKSKNSQNTMKSKSSAIPAVLRPHTALDTTNFQKQNKTKRPHTSPPKIKYPMNICLASPGMIMAELIILPK